MLSLAEQITRAANHARREADYRAAEARQKAERQAETRAKQWASRKAGGNGVAEALLGCLPETAQSAITLEQIKTLLVELDATDGAISGALSILVTRKKTVARTGERRNFHYYLAKGKSK